MIGTVPLMAVRWRWLLRAQGIDDRLSWLTRTYFTSYTAGQVLPTAIGGDAWRVLETSRRHHGRTGDIDGDRRLERALGGVATLALGAIGFLLAVGRYDVGAYLWIEGVRPRLVRARVPLRAVGAAAPRAAPARAHRLRVERPMRALYDGVHHYRGHLRLLAGVFAYTTLIQAVRVLSIWAAGKAVGIGSGPGSTT